MIRFVPATGSTNADLLALGGDAREGDWLVARRQSAGRGRAGRVWFDGAGNFMGSTVVALQPGDPAAPTLALVTGLAVFESIATIHGLPERLMLKWPNDVLLDGAKLAGILLERAGDVVVIGVGVNLARAPGMPGRTTAALADVGLEIAVEDFAERLAVRLTMRLDAWRNGGWPWIRTDWLARAHSPGTLLEIKDRDGAPIRGAFAGLGDDGTLHLRLADGSARAISAGDVELVA